MTAARGVDIAEPALQESRDCAVLPPDSDRAGHRVKRAGLIVTMATAALALPACAALSPPKQLDTYELSAPAPGEAGGRSRAQILIAEPTALKALDGQNIVIKPAAGTIQYLEGAQWADRLPKIVQARLAETFQKSGKFEGVGKPGEGLAIDYQVIAEVREFDIRVDGVSRANVEIFIKLLNDRNGVVRASRTFEATAAVGGSSNGDFVAALDRAFGNVASEIVDWTQSII